jgi:hypothetical protein
MVHDLYMEKLKRMSDDDLLFECMDHGKTMEQGILTDIQKDQITKAFMEGLSRQQLEPLHDVMRAALRVLRLIS